MQNKKNIKRKYIFLGDTDSINLEIIINSHNFLKKKIELFFFFNKFYFYDYIKKIKLNYKINEILDPINFLNYKKDFINIFNIENKYKKKYKNLLRQLNFSNEICNSTGFDLITMPIDKSIFKKEINFIGVTEYLGKINKKNTFMLMKGEQFSVIPITTHINVKEIHKNLTKNNLNYKLEKIINLISLKKYSLDFSHINFICYNPHCGENTTIGKEDGLIDILLKQKKFKEISGPYPADSAFNNIKRNTLFISTYHDQALIPFKILNKKGINLTLGLNYRRLSPAHGTAKDIKFQKKSDNSSYIQCMLS